MCITHCIQYTEPLLKFLLGLLVSLGVPEYSHLLPRDHSRLTGYCGPASLRALSTEFSWLRVGVGNLSPHTYLPQHLKLCLSYCSTKIVRLSILRV